MPPPTIQNKIREIISTLGSEDDISAPMFFHLTTSHKSTVNKALRRLCLKGLIDFDRTVPNSQGKGKETNIYRKTLTPKVYGFQFGVIKEGVFADLFQKPALIKGAKVYKNLVDSED